MRFLMLLALVVFGSEGFALEVAKHGGRLFVTEACDQGGGVLRSLAAWSAKAQTGKKCNMLARGESMMDAKSCRYDITDCVPDHVVQYQGANPKLDGPNCWNLSLVMSKILPNLRYSTPEEMNFYMRPPLCRQLKDGEAREPGDVGAIREVSQGGTTETHGFIYISEKLAYSKNGMSRKSPYALQTLENVYDVYDVPQQAVCRKNEINVASAKCNQAVAYFRCDSMESYLSKTKNVPADIKKAYNDINAVDACMEKSAFSGQALSNEAQKNVLETSQALLTYLEKSKSSPEIAKIPKEEREFILGSLQLRLAAIADQMQAIAMGTQSVPTYESSLELSALSEAIHDASKNIAGGK
ncbi:hypothetical protein [Bdellovibrio sp.]|uniref:hypothetical protein n=1 Tax=Bdellovibrio TaxID=958 RepID=UPI003221DB5C